MTAKEFVKERMPKARPEKHKTNRGEVYWLIRNGRDYMYLAEGKTESNAWVNAKEKLMKQDEARENDKVNIIK